MENHDNLHPRDVSTPPDNNLVWGIVSTILCCLPLGIVSIVKATDVNKKWAMGDIEGAHQSAADAKKFAIWSGVAALVFWIVYIIFAVVIGIGGAIFGG